MNATTLIKAGVLIFIALIAIHWLTAGTDEIIEGPLDDPKFSHLQPDE